MDPGASLDIVQVRDVVPAAPGRNVEPGGLDDGVALLVYGAVFRHHRKVADLAVVEAVDLGASYHAFELDLVKKFHTLLIISLNLGPEPARAAADPGSKVKAENRRFLVRRSSREQIFLFLMLFVCFACCFTRKKANRKNNSYDSLFLWFG